MTLTSHVKVPGSITVSWVLGNSPSPSQLRSVSVSTQTGHTITVPCDFCPVGKLCRLGSFSGFFGGIAIIRSCAWRIPANRYKMRCCWLTAYASQRKLILASIELKQITPRRGESEIRANNCFPGARLGPDACPIHPETWACPGPVPPVTTCRASQAKSCRFDCPAGDHLSVWCSPPSIRRLRRRSRHGAPDRDQQGRTRALPQGTHRSLRCPRLPTGCRHRVERRKDPCGAPARDFNSPWSPTSCLRSDDRSDSVHTQF